MRRHMLKQVVGTMLSQTYKVYYELLTTGRIAENLLMNDELTVDYPKQLASQKA